MRLLCLTLCLLFTLPLCAQHIIRGRVFDAQGSESLPGVIIVEKASNANAVTDSAGQFALQTNTAYPVTLTVSYTGYSTQDVVISNGEVVSIRLRSNNISLKEAFVRGSRISEKQKESPLTIEALDLIGIRETPAASFYEGLSHLKGVDLFSASMAFKVLNTRGFSSTSPVRSLQVIDGVDNQSPGLNFSLGNFLGASELDLQRVELVVGAASAYYGPNAFNGVIAMTTRSPFTKPGLEVSVKGGERSMLEGALRWAQVFKNRAGEQKMGYKLNLFYMRAQDWEANNLAPTPQSRNAADNPGGYDAVNVYGDEFITGSDYTAAPGAFPGLGAFYRTGYREMDLVDYGVNNMKANAAIHYRIMPKVEVAFSSAFASGTTIYRGDNPILLKDVRFFQNKVELKNEGKWFIRAYATNEDAGNTYDIYTTGLLLQRGAKSDGNFKQDYENFWNSNYGLGYVRTLPGFPQPPTVPGEPYVQWLASINPYLKQHYGDSLIAWHNAAQEYANSANRSTDKARYKPGTAAFDSSFNGITSRSIASGEGSKYIDRSALYHIQAEYRFSPSFCNVVTGGNFRMFAPNSEGTIFSDTAGTTIRNSEFGLYAGAEKKLMKDKLKATLTTRIDKNQNFPLLFSPAASLVYQPAKDHYLRLSFSSAIRNPTLQDQYFHLYVGRALLAGNIHGFEDLVTIPSLITAFDYDRRFDSLSYFDVPAVRPEKVKTLEAGYRGTVRDRFYVDVSGYFSRYRDFIGYKIGADVDTKTVMSYPIIELNEIYRVATNATDEVSTMGASVGINYYLGRNYAITSNYSWNRLDRHGSEDPLIPAFNTPEHKFNIGFNGRDIKNFSFNVNYRWIEGYTFEGSPQFTGSIASYGLVDAQVSRQFSKPKLTIKLGASNLFDNLHYEVYGGPLIGRMIYLSALLSVN